jgi:hypothetical protein
MVRVQAGQVRSARLQMTDAISALHGSVDRVSERIRELDEDCLVLKGFENITAATGGSIQILLDGIESAGCMVKDAAAAARACQRPLSPLKALADGLASDIDNTGEKMCRIALNTQLIAVQQGSGTGLEVLAGKMAATAAAISQICQMAEKGLESLTLNLNETIHEHERIAEAGDLLTSAFEGPGAQRILALHALRDSALQTMCELGAAADTSRLLIAQMKQTRLDRICDVMAAIESALFALADWAGELSRDLNGPQVLSEEIERLARDYTMDSERQVHAIYLDHASQGVFPHGDDAAATPVGALDGSLDSNIELF